MKTEKYILSKPWNVGKFNHTFKQGSILEVDKAKDVFTSEGREFQGLAELKMAMTIKDKRTGAALILPYNEKSGVVKSLLNSVKDRIEENNVAVQKYKVIQSDSDLNEDIDISSLKTQPKAKVNNKDKMANLEVIPEAKISIPNKKLSSADEIAKRLKTLEGPAKMKVIKDTEASEPLSAPTSKVKVRALPGVSNRQKK